MTKESGAFLTIGELSAELNIPQHILRYWETRFPALRPLQRAGNRRYYRPDDVELARRINKLLNVDGYTVRGAQQALAGKIPTQKAGGTSVVSQPAEVMTPTVASVRPDILPRLLAIRANLEAALG